jgi:hypothetical protein
MRGEDDVSESDIEQWLDNDDGDPGYQILSQAEIAENVLQGKEKTTMLLKKNRLHLVPSYQ